MRLKKYRMKPNQAELNLLGILHENFPGKFKWNGGEVTIEGKIPDVLRVDQHKIILELVGRRDIKGHTEEDLEVKRTLYEKWGFHMMIIDTKDLKDEEKLCNDILFFVHFNLPKED